MTTEIQLPKYNCHKQVWALKIKRIDYDPQPIDCSGPTAALITPAENGYAQFYVDSEYTGKHQPEEGGYYVVYADGYKSYSPAKAFEEGYSLAE